MEQNIEHLILIFQLLVIYQIKHFLADFPLQTEYMLGKFKAKDWELPLFVHASVHALMTFGIVYYFLRDPAVASYMMMLDLVTHFTIDRIKASPYMFGKYKPDQKLFWFALGADQFLHHITHYIIIFTIVYYTYL